MISYTPKEAIEARTTAIANDAERLARLVTLYEDIVDCNGALSLILLDSEVHRRGI